jgi:hypoxanthine phosphoribosyltransferase
MPRKKPTPTRGVLEVDWAFFGELCRALAVRVSQGFDPEVVVGVAKAGVIPAAIVATILQREFAAIVIARASYDAEPQLVVGPPDFLRGKRVLLVDETCDSGDTMRLAIHAIRGVKPADLRTAVSFKTGEWAPDFHAFETDKAIVLPWDREVVEGGELVTRPDLDGWVST